MVPGKEQILAHIWDLVMLIVLRSAMETMMGVMSFTVDVDSLVQYISINGVAQAGTKPMFRPTPVETIYKSSEPRLVRVRALSIASLAAGSGSSPEGITTEDNILPFSRITTLVVRLPISMPNAFIIIGSGAG